MKGIHIQCESCRQYWQVEVGFSFYSQQAMESCPCPHCGACTLTCHDPAVEVLVNEPPAWYSPE